MNFTTMDQDNDILVVVFQKTYCAVMHLSSIAPPTPKLDTATCVINAPDDGAAWSINSLLLWLVKQPPVWSQRVKCLEPGAYDNTPPNPLATFARLGVVGTTV